MQIRSGASRRVLLIGDVAIKFARFNVLRLFIHLYWMVCKPKLARRKFEARYRRTTFVHSLFAYLTQLVLGGIRANRQERRLYLERPDLPLARVRAVYLGGYLLVMDRGQPASEALAAPLCARFPGGDLDQLKHVCLFGDTPRYIDYGHADAPHIFSTS